MKQPLCKTCKQPFERIKSIQSRCISCTIQRAKELEAKVRTQKAKVQKAEMKERIKTLSDYKKDLQKVINEIVRTLDGNECISCGQVKERLDAGHFYPTSTDGTIRFHLWNIHGQCRYCNLYKHGAINNYNQGIIKRYGENILNTIKDLPEIYRHKIEKQEIIDAIVIAKDCLNHLRKNYSSPFTIEDKIKLRDLYNKNILLYK